MARTNDTTEMGPTRCRFQITSCTSLNDTGNVR